MFVRFHHVGRISGLSALAAAVVVAGVAAVALVIVGGAACAVWLARAAGRIGGAGRRVPLHDHDTLEGVVVDSTNVSDQLLRLDSDKG